MPVETVVNTVREKDVHLVGLSALMTTTLKSMEETIRALHDAKLDCKIMVGGAVLTPEYAKKIGAAGTPRMPSRVPILPRSSLAYKLGY